VLPNQSRHSITAAAYQQSSPVNLASMTSPAASPSQKWCAAFRDAYVIAFASSCAAALPLRLPALLLQRCPRAKTKARTTS